MRVFVSTCDRYDHLLQGFAVQFNKYWGSHQRVTVLGFRQPPKPLPPNFSFVSFEPVETRSWTANHRLFFEAQRDSHFTWLLDDYWLTKRISLNAVRLVEHEVVKRADKGDLSLNTQHFAHTRQGDWLIARPDAQYRTSTQPAIWRREHLLSLLQGDRNPWEFELQDTPAVRRGLIIGTRFQIYEYANVYFKGAPHHMVNLISDTDKQELCAAGAFDSFNPKPC